VGSILRDDKRNKGSMFIPLCPIIIANKSPFSQGDVSSLAEKGFELLHSTEG
jgi:hypothetical protein